MSIAILDDRVAETADQEYLLLEPVDSESDDELLTLFVAHREDWAFEQLVIRHAPLVLAVCRRVLANEQDAEDAFQATILVLARKASSLRKAKSLPAWLHKTAFHIALRAKAQRARRRELPLETEPMIPAAELLTDIAHEHDHSVLDEELNRLPERYRLPLFLCCLEGKSREEAAQQLGWQIGSLKGRLERGRQLLRQRLLMRGVSLGIALTIVSRTPSIAAATQALSPSLVSSTVHAGLQHAAGQSLAGIVSPNVISLAHGSFLIMSVTTKIVVGGCLAVGLLATGLSSSVVPLAVGEEGKGPAVVVTGDAALQADPLQVLEFVAALDGDEERRDQPRSEGERRETREGQKDAERDPREAREANPLTRRVEREGDREPERNVRDGERPRGEGFRPTTPNEEALYNMIQQLQREVAELRRMLQGREGDARGREAGRDGDVRREGDRAVREGEREVRDSDRARPDAREGERAKDAPREGEREKEAPRDGEREKDTPRL